MIQERKDAGQDDYRKGKMKDKMDTEKERIHKRIDAEEEGFRR